MVLASRPNQIFYSVGTRRKDRYQKAGRKKAEIKRFLKAWGSRGAGTIEKAVGGNRRKQKIGSRECQNSGATVAPRLLLFLMAKHLYASK